jgi:hypothetical protein
MSLPTRIYLSGVKYLGFYIGALCKCCGASHRDNRRRISGEREKFVEGRPIWKRSHKVTRISVARPEKINTE